MDVIENTGVAEVKEGWLSLKDERKVEFDECLWCTEAAAAPWLRDTPGLPTGRCTSDLPCLPSTLHRISVLIWVNLWTSYTCQTNEQPF